MHTFCCVLTILKKTKKPTNTSSPQKQAIPGVDNLLSHTLKDVILCVYYTSHPQECDTVCIIYILYLFTKNTASPEGQATACIVH